MALRLINEQTLRNFSETPMKLLRLTGVALALGTSVVLLSACGNAGAPASFAPAAQAQPLKHPLSVPRKSALLYVTDEGNYNVYVYTYPAGSAVGTLTSAYGSPTGECVDKHGNVYITEYNGDEVLAYHHGASSPFKILSDPGYPIGCAVDPSTGNLAVANEMDPSGGYGDVAIWAKAKGNPTMYTDSQLELPYWCAYDRSGNLFVDGEYIQSGFQSSFAELPKGSSTLANITLPFALGTPPGGVVWDGKYVTVNVGDLIYRLTITGSTASVVGSTTLSGGWNPPTYTIVGKKLIATSGGNIGFFHYPKSGGPIATISQNWPWSTAVSK